ncbi:MAG: peptidyl-prolyl cis-trans isomerase [Candidatus Doudnabacteria bacterium]|nr:peptidyl-prolyl cis-trans isomerase [Candidatus Doudnabacteria bacterium]
MNISSEINNNLPKPKHLFWAGIAIILGFLLISVTIAYATAWQDPISKSFKKLYPSALVGSVPVSIEDSDAFVALASKMDGNVSGADAFDMYLKHIKSDLLLKRLGLKLPSDAISDELYFYKKSPEYDNFLRTYFRGSEKLFKENVVAPQAVEARLRIKYNSDFNLNQKSYQKAENVLERLNAGEKFEDVAKQFSADKKSAQFGGDLGFFEHGQILPELEKAITVAKIGEVHDIIVTRDGYEIVYPIETSMIDGKKMWHAKHILIETTGFDPWLANLLGDMPVKKIKNY